LAGARGGLNAPRSGAFWGFWRLIEALDQENRAPPILCLENVAGLLTSHEGRDFAALCATLDGAGYRVGALTIDASAFLPQSRPRVFMIAARLRDVAAFAERAPAAPFHNEALQASVARLPQDLQKRFVWWRLASAPARNTDLSALLDQQPSVCWDGAEKTARLLAMMSATQRARIDTMQKSGAPRVGAVFRRIRIEQGKKVQRAEARFDGLAGCLRTPAGGSSRQGLIFVEGARIRTRLLSAREAARLMGLDETYPLPKSQSAALHLIGDGVAVPVVRHLSHHLLEPLARALQANRKAA
jgi:DNA (cytosine-5)-methyltransferase 1